jgi:hypothetical protein
VKLGEDFFGTQLFWVTEIMVRRMAPLGSENEKFCLFAIDPGVDPVSGDVYRLFARS